MENSRKICRIIHGQSRLDGAGVRLYRLFGLYEQGMFDPFLQLDFLNTDNPFDYISGFPMHFHKGIQTITYLISGEVEYSDSLGNNGVMRKGDVQVMTAGKGISHRVTPQYVGGRLMAFQLWINLPTAKKMMTPGTKTIRSDEIPTVTLQNGIKIKVLAGQFGEVIGKAKDVIVAPNYYDIEMPENTELIVPITLEHKAFAFIFHGNVKLGNCKAENVHSGQLVLFGQGSQIIASSNDQKVRFLLFSAEPINEPIAWRGSMVMNSETELIAAIKDSQEEKMLIGNKSYL